DEKDPVYILPAFRHRGICAVRRVSQQPTAGLRVSKPSGARSLYAHVSGAERPCLLELHLRSGRKAAFGLPAGRGRFSRRLCPRNQEAARPVEKVQRRLGKPVGRGADAPVRGAVPLISGCAQRLNPTGSFSFRRDGACPGSEDAASRVSSGNQIPPYCFSAPPLFGTSSRIPSSAGNVNLG